MTELVQATLAAALMAASLSFIVAVLVRGLLHDYRQHYEQRWQNNLTSLFLFVRVRDLVLIWFILLSIVIFVASFFLDSWWSLGVLTVLGIVLPWQSYKRMQKRRQQHVTRQLPAMLTLLSTTLRSGGTVAQGIAFAAAEMTAPLGQELQIISRQLRLGKSLPVVFKAFAELYPSDDLHRIYLALDHGQSLGGKQAQLLDSLAQTLRRKQQLEQRIKSLSAQGRLQGKVMTAMPLFILLVLWGIEGESLEQLSQHPIGWGLAALLVVMLCGGHWLMQRLLKIEVAL
ncbi:MAG: type II secretion system F family protein [Gammaproteobacteria bacterium]|nr:type II secretion system F family protein [Gammaproteobacteria bacterium]MCL5255709.1 type II secretion system F family protein [Gammaproteobacteria bacterium]